MRTTRALVASTVEDVSSPALIVARMLSCGMVHLCERARPIAGRCLLAELYLRIPMTVQPAPGRGVGEKRADVLVANRSSNVKGSSVNRHHSIEHRCQCSHVRKIIELESVNASCIGFLPLLRLQGVERAIRQLPDEFIERNFPLRVRMLAIAAELHAPGDANPPPPTVADALAPLLA